MPIENHGGLMTDDQKKEIFYSLVQAQDQAMSVSQSRAQIATQYSISEEQVRQIEREGLDSQWPPLDE